MIYSDTVYPITSSVHWRYS